MIGVDLNREGQVSYIQVDHEVFKAAYSIYEKLMDSYYAKVDSMPPVCKQFDTTKYVGEIAATVAKRLQERQFEGRSIDDACIDSAATEILFALETNACCERERTPNQYSIPQIVDAAEKALYQQVTYH